METCLHSRCPATSVTSGSIIEADSHYSKIFFFCETHTQIIPETCYLKYANTILLQYNLTYNSVDFSELYKQYFEPCRVTVILITANKLFVLMSSFYVSFDINIKMWTFKLT
jgi:hypothetical protein